MALTVTLDGTIIDSCEAVGSWSRIGGGKAPSLNSDIVRQGNSSLSDKSTTQSGYMWDLGAGGTDLSAQQVYGWFNCLKPSGLATRASSGIEIYLQDTSGNWGTYEVGGSDDYLGGWQCFTAFTGDAFDNNGGTDPTITSIRYVGIRWNYTGSWSGGDPNIFMDQMWYGKGLIVTGTGPGDLDEIEAADQSNANAYGVLQKVGGVFQLQGLITLGDAGGTGDCYFLDKNQVIAIQDRYKSAHELFGFKIVGNGTGTTDVDFGEVISGVGLSGCVFLGQGNSDPIIEDTDADVAEANFYGCTFIACGTITFEQSGHEIRNCVFDGCGEITSQGATFENCTISNGSQTRALNLATTHNVKDCAFNNNTNAVHVDTATGYTFDNLTFSGNTVDIENSASATQVDSYPDTNGDTTVQLYSGATTRLAQSFVGTAGKLSRAIFSLQRAASPTGNVVAKLYADTGGSGPGTLLATSEVVDITGIGVAWAQVDFEFEDEYTLAAATTYWISVEYSGGDSTNRLEVEVDSSAPGHSGSCYSYTGSWSSETYDMCFYANRNGIVTVNATNGADPATADETAATKGATIISNTKTLTVTTKNTSGLAIPSVNVRIEKDPAGTLISEGQTDGSGVYSDGTYNYLGDQDVLVVTRKKGLKNNRAFDTIKSTGLSVPFTMIRDTSVNLP